MSDKNNAQEPLTVEEETSPVKEQAAEEPAAAEEPVTAQTTRESGGARSGNPVAWLAFVFAIIALTAAGYTTWQNRKASLDTSAGESYARLEERISTIGGSLSDLETQIVEVAGRDAGVEAEIDALRRELDERIRLLSSLPARISTLESSVASLAGVSEGARDTWVLAEAEYYMQIANAQLQLANNPHLAALALRMADERIVQLANPALTDVRRAISDELAALEGMEKPDVEGATLTLASLARVVESLPLAATAEPSGDASAIDPELSGVQRAWASVKNAMSGLVKVTPPEQAKLAQLSPDTEFFLRNNIALQLQSARLALLRGEQAIFEQSLDDTNALLNEYFATDSAQVASAQRTIAEIRSYVFTTDAPDISESLRLLRQFRTLSENER